MTASDGAANDEFGYSVSVSADTAVIAALGNNSYQGAAYVFVRSGGTWSQQQELTASDGVAGNQFGVSVSASGDTAVIGAYGQNIYQGSAYVFVGSGGTWSQQQELTASDGAASNNFGYSVSVSGDTAVVGAWRNNNLGAAYVFLRSGGMWDQSQEVPDTNGAANDEFGNAVSVSGDTVVIGAPGKNTGQGAAYVFAQARLGTNALLVGSGAGTSSVVLSYSGAWAAIANDSFLHISAGSASGTNSAVVVFNYDTFAGTGTRAGTLTIAGLTVTVTQAGTNYIGPTGSAVVTLGPNLGDLAGVAVDGSGNVYVVDEGDGAVKEWSASTQHVATLVSSGLNGPIGIAVDGSGNVYIADQYNNAIKEWSASTQQVTALVSSGLYWPQGVAVDGSNNVYVADTNNQAIKEWSASTQQVTTLVASGLNDPIGMALDVSGNIYFADCANQAVKEWSAFTNQVTTLLSSGLNYPRAATVDGSGNVYIADTNTKQSKSGARRHSR